ncbi:hypothetical protein GW17_00027724 [Ensete ventricosum]|nr:hypothetical protein GW17_00027724 [Ensete ventricosum]
MPGRIWRRTWSAATRRCPISWWSPPFYQGGRGLGNNDGSSRRSLGQERLKRKGLRKGRRVSRRRVVEIARPRRMPWCL